MPKHNKIELMKVFKSPKGMFTGTNAYKTYHK